MLGRTHVTAGAAFGLASLPLVEHYTPVHGWNIVVYTILAGGAGVLPDLDHPAATPARMFGVITRELARGIHAISGGHRRATHALTAGLPVFVGLTYLAAAHQALPNMVSLIVVIWFLLGLAARGLVHRRWHCDHGHRHDGPDHKRSDLCLKVKEHLAGLGHAAIVLAAATGVVLADPRIGPITVAAVTTGVIAHIVMDCLTVEGCPILWPVPFRVRLTPMATGHWCEKRLVLPALIIAVGVLAAHTADPGLTVTSHRPPTAVTQTGPAK